MNGFDVILEKIRSLEIFIALITFPFLVGEMNESDVFLHLFLTPERLVADLTFEMFFLKKNILTVINNIFKMVMHFSIDIRKDKEIRRETFNLLYWCRNTFKVLIFSLTNANAN